MRGPIFSRRGEFRNYPICNLLICVVLLGPGESGKSTFFKQMKILQVYVHTERIHKHTFEPYCPRCS